MARPRLRDRVHPLPGKLTLTLILTLALTLTLFLTLTPTPTQANTDAAPPAHVHVTSSGAAERHFAPRAGSLLLTLSRRASVRVPAAESASLAAQRPLWLTMHMYSVHLRSAADDRMLGISVEKRRQIMAQRRSGELVQEG